MATYAGIFLKGEQNMWREPTQNEQLKINQTFKHIYIFTACLFYISAAIFFCSSILHVVNGIHDHTNIFSTYILSIMLFIFTLITAIFPKIFVWNVLFKDYQVCEAKVKTVHNKRISVSISDGNIKTLIIPKHRKNIQIQTDDTVLIAIQNNNMDHLIFIDKIK